MTFDIKIKIMFSEVIHMERTLIILKPDAVRRKLMGELISRIERKNLEITNIKLEHIKINTAKMHYDHVKHLPIYGEMINYMTASPALIMVVSGEKAIQVLRNMIGKTNTFDAQPGTIRGDYGLHLYENLIHASDSMENAEIEINRFFGI